MVSSPSQYFFSHVGICHHFLGILTGKCALFRDIWLPSVFEKMSLLFIIISKLSYEPSHKKTNDMHRQKKTPLFSPFGFYLHPKFQASSILLLLFRLVCVRPGWFSLAAAHIIYYLLSVCIQIRDIALYMHTALYPQVCVLDKC